METHPSESENPFAPPAEQSAYQPAYDMPTAIWRDGKKLVILKGTQFPPICVKSGEPAEVWLKRKFSWVSPFWYITLFAGLLPAVVILVLLSKRADFKVPVTREVNSRRKKGILLAWAIVGMGVLAIAAGLAIMNSNQTIGGLLMISFFIFLLVGIVVGIRAATIITPSRITKNFAWFSGVNPVLLESLRPWFPSYEEDYRANLRVR